MYIDKPAVVLVQTLINSESRVVREISPQLRPSSLASRSHYCFPNIAENWRLRNSLRSRILPGTNNLAAICRGQRHAAVRAATARARRVRTRRKSGHRDVSNEKALGFFRCGVYFPRTVLRAGPQHWHAVTQDRGGNVKNATALSTLVSSWLLNLSGL